MAFTAIAAGLGLASSIAGIFKGASDSRKAKRAINNYKRQELTNPYGSLQVSTLGAELQEESANRRAASMVKALQGMGGRGVLGGLSTLEAQQQEQERKIAADLDQQSLKVAELRARGESERQGLQEQREREDLAGLGAQLSAGQQTMWGGISSAVGLVGNIAQAQGTAKAGGGDIFKKGKVNT